MSIILTTYGRYEEVGDIQHELVFEVPDEWFEEWCEKNGWNANAFLNGYIWDDAMQTYADAKADGVIIQEEEV